MEKKIRPNIYLDTKILDYLKSLNKEKSISENLRLYIIEKYKEDLKNGKKTINTIHE